MNCPSALGRRPQYVLVIIFIVTGVTFYFLSFREGAFDNTSIRLFKFNENTPVAGFLVHTPGCRIPDMDPFDKSVLPYVRDLEPMACGTRPLIQSNQTSIWIDAEAITDYNVTEISDITCCYRPFYRSVDESNRVDSSIDFSNECTKFEESANVYEEFVKVTCKAEKRIIYQDFHAFIIPKTKEVMWKNSIKQDDLSVLIIGADSLSKLNFHRQMPMTRKFMKILGAIEFFGYNKVEDNTFPNLIPMLTGYSVKEITDVCWHTTSDYFDECPFIWKNFSAKNYYTVLAEDAFWMGMFNYEKKGFKNPPTDYYTRPYILANEKMTGHTKPLNTYFCDGSRFAAEVLFDYAYKFSVNMTLSNKKFWGLFWESSLTHDFVNDIPNVDDIFYNLFNKLQQEGVFNKTAVFFLSDHGMRWGSIRETYQGRMEEHLPFLYVLLPEWFQTKHSTAVRNMKQNCHALTTHFDVYETMLDLLDTDLIEEGKLKDRAIEGWKKRAMSLFLPVSEYRTCKSAGIEPMWCTCQRSKNVSTSNVIVQKAAFISVLYLNNLLKNETQCAKLKLNMILSAHVEEEEKLLDTDTTSVYSDYVIIFITQPGLAKFEATIRHRSDNQEMVVMGKISRINTYGSQSKCISNYNLKLYCYCTL